MGMQEEQVGREQHEQGRGGRKKYGAVWGMAGEVRADEAGKVTGRGHGLSRALEAKLKNLYRIE